jgi:hypothetical protein
MCLDIARLTAWNSEAGPGSFNSAEIKRAGSRVFAHSFFEKGGGALANKPNQPPAADVILLGHHVRWSSFANPNRVALAKHRV